MYTNNKKLQPFVGYQFMTSKAHVWSDDALFDRIKRLVIRE